MTPSTRPTPSASVARACYAVTSVVLPGVTLRMAWRNGSASGSYALIRLGNENDDSDIELGQILLMRDVLVRYKDLKLCARESKQFPILDRRPSALLNHHDIVLG